MGEINKRFRLFEYKNNDYLLDMNDAVGLYDPNVDYLEFLGQALPIEDICDLLNQLNDENEQLNQKHRQLQIDYNELAGINTDYRELTYDLTDLIEDLGSEEMRRQMKQILNKSHISEFKCWAVKGE